MPAVRSLAPARASSQTRRIAIAVVVAIYLLLIVRSAWLMDDAYITFRVVDNALHGYGLRWNIDERVQAFTNPLWTLLMIALVKMTDELFYTAHLTQIALSFTTVLLVARRARSTAASIGGVVLLILCKAFVDYSTSGLENALGHLLLTLFCGLYFQDRADARRLRLLSLLAALGLTNRLDLLWIYAPCLLQASWLHFRSRPATSRRQRWRAALGTLGIVASGMSIFLAWEAFAFFYYGSFIANSALAKINTGLSTRVLVWNGIYYFFNALRLDPITLPVIAVAIYLALSLGNGRHRALAGGIALNLIYVVRVGGDHMSGRFFSVPYLAAVILLVDLPLAQALRSWSIVVGGGLALAWLNEFPSLNTQFYSLPSSIGSNVTDTTVGIDDDFRDWYGHTGLVTRSVSRRGTEHEWAETGKNAAKHPEQAAVLGGLGLPGYFGGPKLKILDWYALTDPLRARLPMPNAKWQQPLLKPGHYKRPLPPGYQPSFEHDDNETKNPALSAYYQRIRFVTRGPLWSWKRLVTAARLNVGMYGHFLAEYLKEYEEKPVNLDWLPPKGKGFGTQRTERDGYDFESCGADDGCFFTDGGVRIELPENAHPKELEVALDGGGYIVEYRRDDRVVTRETVVAPGTFGERRHFVLSIPAEVAERGLQAIAFLPREPRPELRKITFAEMRPLVEVSP